MQTYKKILFQAGVFLVSGVAFAPQGLRDLPRFRVQKILQREASPADRFTRRQITEAVLTFGREYKIDPMLILAMIKVESQFNPEARSHRDAVGLMQIRSIVIHEIADDLTMDASLGCKRLTEPTFNIRVGVHYLAQLLTRFGGDMKKALTAYNMGPTTVARLYKNRPAPSTGYSHKVLKVYRDYLSS